MRKVASLKSAKLKNVVKEPDPITPMTGVDGVEMDVEGIVTFVCESNEDVYFRVHVSSMDSEVLCVYNEQYPIRANDRVSASGTFCHRVCMGLNQQCLECHSVYAMYVFDLNNFLIQVSPNMNQQLLNKVAAGIVDYADVYHSDEPEGTRVIAALGDLSSQMESMKDEIGVFTEMVYGDRKHERAVRQMLITYRNDALRRPLQLLGVSNEVIEQISFNNCLKRTYDIIRENPYRIPEIDIVTAERICTNCLRMSKINPLWKVCGAINREVLRRLRTCSWTSVPMTKLEKAFPTTFEKNRELLEQEYGLSSDFGSMYMHWIKKKEEYVATVIARLITAPLNDPIVPIYPGRVPSDEQREAICGALKNRISIITGGAGTGKTYIEGELCRAIINAGHKPLCVAYTGAAVQRMKSSLRDAHVLDECYAYTIHMACSYATMFQRVKYIIFDEFSMVDLSLFNMFLRSFEHIDDMSLIFVGDIMQISPISPGAVLERFLETPITVYRLTKNYRSEHGILRITNEIIDQERFREQRMIDWQSTTEDYQFYEGNEGVRDSYIQHLYDEFVHSCGKRSDIHEDDLSAYDAEFIKYRDEIMFVDPFRKTVDETNREFQRVFMSEYPSVVIDGKLFFLHDRMMKLVNNHTIEVMNGEIGNIVELKSDYIVVRFRPEIEGINVPFFSKYRLSRMKKVRKLVDYTVTENVDGKPRDKSMDQIRNELTEIRGRLFSKKRMDVLENDVNEFFDVALEFPRVIFGVQPEKTEFLSLDSVMLAYNLTVMKSQGSQFSRVIATCFEPFRRFVTYRQVYVALSRAKSELTVIASSEMHINSCCLTPPLWSYDNLAIRINSKLPESMRPVVQLASEEDDYDEFDFDDDDLDLSLD
jgi:hypothetical protein